MRWSKEGALRAARVLPWWSAAALLILASALLLSGAPEEKRLTVYSAASNYSLTVLERNGNDYVGLAEILGPLGNVTTKTEGSKWRVRYNGAESEFTSGKNRARVRGQQFDLAGNFLLENGHGLVPAASLGGLLPRILGGPVTFHELSRRLFIGNVAVHFTAQVSKSTPPQLVLNFTSPVNPMIATEPGKLRMVFAREAVVPPSSQTLTFDNRVISSASYGEGNGTAELVVNGSVSLMASFSSDGRTITIGPAPQAAGQGAAISNPTAAAPTPELTSPSAPASVTAVKHYFAVVDASHGGEERGAAISDQLAEKDVTLAFARRLRQELENRGLSVLLLRDGDNTLSLDQRAAMANAVHPAIYLCLHATSEGNGARLYTDLLPAGGESKGPFLDWNSAQSGFLSVSQAAAASVAAELRSKQVTTRVLSAPLRPLNNLTAAALAVEVAPPESGVAELNSSEYQQQISSAVAAGLNDLRSKMEAGR